MQNFVLLLNHSFQDRKIFTLDLFYISLLFPYLKFESDSNEFRLTSHFSEQKKGLRLSKIEKYGKVRITGNCKILQVVMKDAIIYERLQKITRDYEEFYDGA